MNIALVVLVGMVLSFWLGYEAANKDAERIRHGLQDQLRLAEQQRYQLASWVRKHWPTEYAAYRQGIEEGYQQGVTHAPALMDDADAGEYDE